MVLPRSVQNTVLDSVPNKQVVRELRRDAALLLQPGEERADGAAHQGVLLEGHFQAVGGEQLLQQRFEAQRLGAEGQDAV